jgi:glycosyltransferase involved in cell wall biosynthesis
MEILGDPTGGIRKHVHDIINSSFKYNFNMYYIYGTTLDPVAKFQINEFNLKGVNTLKLEIKKKPHISDILNIIKLVRYCKNNKINVIHGHGAKGGVYCRVVGLLSGVPSIYTPHGGSVHAAYGKTEGFVYRLVERMLKSATSFFLFESNYTYKSFVKASGKLLPNKFLVNYNGIDINSLSPTKQWMPKDKIINLLVVGVLREIKGQLVAILALTKLNEMSKIRFHLHFCGSGPDLDKLITVVKSYGLTDHITFHGEVADIIRLYEISNIVVVPSLYESFGYVAIEAALMRRPVVASNCGGLSEIIINEKTGYLFTPGDHSMLAINIINIIKNVEKSNLIVNAAEERTKEIFNLTLMLNNIYSTYGKFSK